MKVEKHLTQKTKLIFPYLAILIGLFLVFIGFRHGEFPEIISKATNLCLG
jgi:hypothetical protein